MSARHAGRQVSRAPAPVSRAMVLHALWGKPATVDKEAVLAEVATQFDRWNSALQTRDPKKVASL